MINELKRLKNLEIKKSNLQKARLAAYPLPSFEFGLNYLGITKKGSLNEKISTYVKKWFDNPERYLKPKKDSQIKIANKAGFLTFPSLLDNSQIARFKYNPQSNGTPGRKVALIHLMHWNGRFNRYDKIINFIRNTVLPISTLIHIPAYRGLNPGEDAPADYSSVSSNIGETIFRARQDIQDIQFIARYLKEKMGYKQIGLFTYSLGSSRGIIASVISPELFDFGIFQLVADDFTEAVMKGVATTDIANEINGKISYQLLQKLWATISPGAYSEYFSSLPQNTRVVQCEHDFVFGSGNIEKFNKKIRKQRPDIKLEEVPLSHTTLNSFPMGFKIMLNNIKFIYQHTQMNKYKRSIFFN